MNGTKACLDNKLAQAIEIQADVMMNGLNERGIMA
jgi:hypothetical protein